MNKKYKKEQNNHLHVCERKSENSSSSFIQYISWQHVCMLLAANVFTQSTARHTYKVEELIENHVLYISERDGISIFVIGLGHTVLACKGILLKSQGCKKAMNGQCQTPADVKTI